MVEYKEFLVNPTPQKLATGEWTIRVEILKNKGASLASTYYLAGNKYKTREEAKKNCINFGKQIIDRKYPKLSLP